MEDVPTPPTSAADKPPGKAAGEPLKAEVSRTDSPAAGVSAARPAEPAKRQTPKPAAAQTATTSEHTSTLNAPAAPEDDRV